MKRFEFQLSRVHELRRQQLEVEEAKLGLLLAERQALESESVRIENEAAATRVSLMVTGSAESQELVASDTYLRRLAVERKRHAARTAEWHGRAAA